DGRTGVLTELDYREQPVLASYSPLDVGDLRWGIVAQLDTAEAFAPAVALRRALLATAAGVTALVAVTAILLARSLTTPLRRLIVGMGRLGRGDLGYRLAEARGDEIGQIAMAFDRMASDLQETTVSRDHVSSADDAADRARAAADHRAREQDRDLPAVVNLVDGLTTADPSVPEHFFEPHPGRTAAGPRSGPDRGNQGADAPPEHLARRVAQHAARLRVHRDDHRVAPVTRIVGRPDDDHRVTHRVEDAAHVVTRD